MTSNQSKLNLEYFTHESLDEIMNYVLHFKETASIQQELCFVVLNPDLYDGIYFNGELCVHQGTSYRHRSYQTWIDLAQICGFSFLTPELFPQSTHLVKLRFRRRVQQGWHHQSLPSGHQEKYGVSSLFQRLHKEEEPYFLKNLRSALHWIQLAPSSRILNLGVNSGRELFTCVSSFLENSSDSSLLKPKSWIGIDHSESAIQKAKSEYPHPSFDWKVGDLRELSSFQLGKFDCIMCLNTLQSTQIDEQKEVRYWVKECLNPYGTLILSFPNSRYFGTHQVYGAQVKHEKEIEFSPLFKQLVALQRYLHQHQFRVRLSGKYTLFLVAKRLK